MPQNYEKTFQHTKRKRKAKQTALTPAQKKLVRKMIDSNNDKIREKKHFDLEGTTLRPISTYTNASTQDIYQPSQGTGDTQRIGDETEIESIFVRYYLRYSDLSTYVSLSVRVLIIQWMEDSLTTGDPSPTDIIQNLSGLHDAYNPRVLDKDVKYRVLHDKIHELNRYDIAGVTEVYINKGFNRFVKFTNAGTSGVGKIYIMYLHGETAAAVDDNPYISFRTRIRYFDA